MTSPQARSNRDPDAGFWTLVSRAVRRRCPRCGQGSSFESAFKMTEHCPSCGFVFEREPGFWVGAMIINTILSFGSLLVVFVGGWVIFWPDVPWTGVLVATIAVALVVPIGFYWLGKSLWSAIELSYHQLDDAERRRATERLAFGPDTTSQTPEAGD